MSEIESDPIQVFAIAVAAYRQKNPSLLRRARQTLVTRHGIKLTFQRTLSPKSDWESSDE
jgi:hypothetical protein